LWSHFPSENGFTQVRIYLNPSFTIASTRITVDVVPSPAESFVFIAASFTIFAPMSSFLSSSSISFATVTPSFVMIGAPYDFSRITFLHFGHIVTLTASATFCTPAKMLFLALSV
jgi:hypothetical protein